MEKDKIDRMIDAFRTAMYQEFSVNEEGMVANAPGEGGGFGGKSPAKGPTAGFDPMMKLDGRNKYVKKAIKDLQDRRDKRKARAEKKKIQKALEFNPYFKPHGRQG